MRTGNKPRTEQEQYLWEVIVVKTLAIATMCFKHTDFTVYVRPGYTSDADVICGALMMDGVISDNVTVDVMLINEDADHPYVALVGDNKSAWAFAVRDDGHIVILKEGPYGPVTEP